MQGREKKQENRIIEFLNSLAESSATVIPLVALVLGIGMVRLLPPKLATPLFYSAQDSQEFLVKLGTETLSEVPVMLVREGCGEACDKLRAEMNQHGVEYDEYDVSSPYGKVFFQKAVDASGSSELPKVIVGDVIVRPDAVSVKRVVQKRLKEVK